MNETLQNLFGVRKERGTRNLNRRISKREGQMKRKGGGGSEESTNLDLS